MTNPAVNFMKRLLTCKSAALNLQLKEHKSINIVSYREVMVSNHAHQDDASICFTSWPQGINIEFKLEYTMLITQKSNKLNYYI